MLVKMIPIIFQIGIKLKIISPSTNRLLIVNINTYTNTMQTFKTIFTQSGALGFYNWENGVKVRPWENAHEKKKRASYLIFIDKFYMLKTLYMQNKLLNGYKRC